LLGWLGHGGQELIDQIDHSSITSIVQEPKRVAGPCAVHGQLTCLLFFSLSFLFFCSLSI
jgi:hypothetical protein